jgi:hypothetical protein
MKKILTILLLVFLADLMIGCSKEDPLNPGAIGAGEGVVESRAERRRRVTAISNLHERMIQDDLDEFWLFDTNSRLSRYDIYYGK